MYFQIYLFIPCILTAHISYFLHLHGDDRYKPKRQLVKFYPVPKQTQARDVVIPIPKWKVKEEHE